MSLVDFDLRDRIAAVLVEHARRPPRVQAAAILRELGGQVQATETGDEVTVTRVDPPRWAKYVERNAPLLAAGVATTRNRTRGAMEVLGLEPDQVRAVVIEPDVIHVFRWADARVNVGMGTPIVED